MEDEGDDSMAILFSLDLDNPASGLISKTDHREMISKSDTGFPFVKLVFFLSYEKIKNILIIVSVSYLKTS